MVQGGIGVYAASQGKGGAGGAMKGAASGAEAGEAFGPIGMAVGAVVGGVIGYLGSSKDAKQYDEKTVKPRIANTEEAYHNGSMDYLSAYSDMENLQAEAFSTLSAMGPSARRYRNDNITPEIKKAEGDFTKEEKAGRSQYGESKASYAVGTDYVPETTNYLLHQGEIVTPADDAAKIRQARGGNGKMPVQSQSMGDIHLHVHAIDAKSSMQFLQDNKHHIRAALNDSFAENSGGGMN
jgi:gas vesicle protein